MHKYTQIYCFRGALDSSWWKCSKGILVDCFNNGYNQHASLFFLPLFRSSPHTTRSIRVPWPRFCSSWLHILVPREQRTILINMKSFQRDALINIEIFLYCFTALSLDVFWGGKAGMSRTFLFSASWQNIRQRCASLHFVKGAHVSCPSLPLVKGSS